MIKHECASMKDGDFTDIHIARVRQLYYNSLLEIEDNQAMLLNNLVDVVFSNNDTIEERRKNIAKVTKEDIIKFASKVHLDQIYFLKGVNS